MTKRAERLGPIALGVIAAAAHSRGPNEDVTPDTVARYREDFLRLIDGLDHNELTVLAAFIGQLAGVLARHLADSGPYGDVDELLQTMALAVTEP